MGDEIRKTTVELSRIIHEGTGQSVCQADVIVPDTMPDSLKVLQVEGKAICESKMMAKGKFSVRGRVECDIIYVPENARGVRCINYTIPFAFSENVEGADERMFLESACEVTHMEYQMVNSRKISIKAVVETENLIVGKQEIQFVSSVNEEKAEARKQNYKGKNRIVCKTADFDVSENIPMPESAEALVKTRGEIKSRNIKIINNKVVAKGELGVCIMFRSGEERLEVISATIPFTEILDAEGINENQNTKITYDLKGIQAKLAQGENGKEARCTFEVSVNICSDEVLEFEAVTDIYGTETLLVPEKEKICFETREKENVTEIELREIVNIEEDAPPIYKVFGVEVKPYVSECSETASGVKTTGTAVCSLTYISEKEDAMVHTCVFEFPFSAIVEGAEMENCKASVKAKSGEWSVSGKNVELRIPLEVKVTNCDVTAAELIKDVTAGEHTETDRPAMVLYFVQKGDSIWEIAKRYHSRICDIERINKISGEEIQEGMMLLIPKK